jgi:hypothetical protein
MVVPSSYFTLVERSQGMRGPKQANASQDTKRTMVDAALALAVVMTVLV